MTERIKRNAHLITNFQQFNKKQRSDIRRHLDNDQTKFICEICSNFLRENFEVGDEIKETLRPFKKTLRKLSGNLPIHRKKVLLQRGEFFPVLLGALASSAISYALERYIASRDGEGKK